MSTTSAPMAPLVGPYIRLIANPHAIIIGNYARFSPLRIDQRMRYIDRLGWHLTTMLVAFKDDTHVASYEMFTEHRSDGVFLNP